MKRLLQLASHLRSLSARAAVTSRSERSTESALHRPSPDDYHHYVVQFAADEREATGQQPADEWPWMEANIPLFDSSNKQFEEMYYFRWYAWEKHLVSTPRGYIITEWLPKPADPEGFFGALPDAAPFHLGEARWLRDPRIAADYARMWADPDAGPRKYSFPWAESVRQVTLATGDTKLGTDLLDALIANYKAWDDHLDPRRRPVLADRHARRHGEIHRRRRLPPTAQQLHARRRARHRGFCARRAVD